MDIYCYLVMGYWTESYHKDTYKSIYCELFFNREDARKAIEKWLTQQYDDRWEETNQGQYVIRGYSGGHVLAFVNKTKVS